MKLDRPIAIDILAFLKTGRFDCIEPGQDKHWILSNFPDPDGMTEKEALRRDYTIWQYGNIEFHFDQDTLFLIFSDYLTTLQGGPSLTLAPWMIDTVPSPSLLDVTAALNREKIDYRKHAKHSSDAIVLTLSPSGVELFFDCQDVSVQDPNFFKLCAFSLMKKSKI